MARANIRTGTLVGVAVVSGVLSGWLLIPDPELSFDAPPSSPDRPGNSRTSGR